MTYLSVSTSKRVCALLLIAAATLGGCAKKQAAPPVTSAFVDMNVLMRRNPGWKSVGAFDEALARLTPADRRAVQNANLTYTLPALTLPAATSAAPGLAHESARLQRIAAQQVDNLSSRLAFARRLQVNREMRALRAASEARLQVQNQTIEADYLKDQEKLLGAQHLEWLNLYLQIQALRKTVKDWSLSVPPTPKLDQAKQELAEKEQAIAVIEKGRGASLVALRETRDQKIRAAREAEENGLAQREAERTAELMKRDGQQIEAERARLMRQMNSMIAQIGELTSPKGARGTTAGAAELPATPAAPASETLDAAKKDLALQRKRWISFLYQDTLDDITAVAAARHWRITLTPSRTAVNRTSEIADVLSATLWRS